MEYRFKYKSTHQDLVDSYNAVRNAQSGMSGWSRGLLLMLGLFWLLGFIFLAPGADNVWQPLIWLALGCTILWKVAIKPHLEIKYIKESNPPEQEVEVAFLDEKIEARSENGEPFLRDWCDIEAFQGFKKGVLVGFSDGVLSWLPSRVFNSQKEKDHFVESVVTRLNAMDQS